MRDVTIRLLKSELKYDIDSGTFKRNDAVFGERSERSQNALTSDTGETLDGEMIARYCDRRDARLRKKLAFCIVETDEEKAMTEFTNKPSEETEYVYNLRLDDSVSTNTIKSTVTKMHEYIVRGALYDWYLYMGMTPSDTEESLEALEDDIAGVYRGPSSGRRPMQPFGVVQLK